MSLSKARRKSSVVSPRHRPSVPHFLSMHTDSSLPPPVMSPTLQSLVLPSDSAKHLPPLFSTIRRFRFGVRPSFVGLLGLLALAAFCLLHQHLNDAPDLSFSHAPSPSRYTTPPGKHSLHRTFVTKPHRPKVVFTPSQELAALITFIAALPSNALSDTIDPLLPIDPDLVLEFDTRTPKAEIEIHDLVEDTWTRLPVVLLSKRYSPVAREIKNILSKYNLDPAPTIFDVDERADASVLVPILYRLTAAVDLPILLISGQPIGSLAKIRELHSSGELRTMISASGAIIDGEKKRKKDRRAVIP